jgi:hypothetical protein
MTRLNTALELAERGYEVFPSRVIWDAEGKKKTQPYVKWITANAATMLPGMIREWWRQWPQALPCIDCGKSGIVVIDCDVKHNSECESGCADGLSRWHDDTDSLPTSSGGRHYFYRANPEHPAGVDADGKIDRHVDVRGVGGMVIVHDVAEITGLPKPVDLKPVPERVWRSVPAGLTKPKESAPADQMLDIPARSFTYQEAVDFCRPAVDDLKNASKNVNINHRLNDAACQFSHFVPHIFTEEEVTEWLIKAQREAWVKSGGKDDGDYSAAYATIRSGLGQVDDPWRAELILDWSPKSPDVSEPFEHKSISDLDREIQRERIRREARRILNEEEATRQASGDAVEKIKSDWLTFDELDQIEDLEPLIDGWLYKDSVARIVGPSGSFKTFFTLDIALSVATKDTWWGYQVNPGPVVYVVAEGARGFRKRARAWMVGRNDCVNVENFYVLPRPIQMLDNEWLALIQSCKDIGASLIVVDTQARVTVGVDENSATDMGRVVDMAERMRRETGACVLLVHHTGYEGKHGRGSTAVYGALQTELSMERDGMNIRVRAGKQKDGEELEANFTMHDVILSDTEKSLVLGHFSEETVSASTLRNDEMQSYIAQAKADADTHARHIALILFELTMDGVGATRAEVRAILNEELSQAGRKAIAKGSESEAWRVLAKGKIIEKGVTPSRWCISDEGRKYLGIPIID